MPKNKSHKASLKRIRLTATGKVRHNRAFGKHLRSGKSGKRLRRLRMDKYMSNPEAKRLEMLLFRRLRGRDQARAALRRSPSPAERREKQAAARAERTRRSAKRGTGTPIPSASDEKAARTKRMRDVAAARKAKK